MKAVVFRANRALLAMSLATLIVLALTLAAPVAAEEEPTAQTTNSARKISEDKNSASGQPKRVVQGSGQQAGASPEEAGAPTAARATDPLQDAAVTFGSGEDRTVNRIEIAAADCDVEKGATVTVSDGDTSETFVDSVDPGGDIAASIESSQDQIVIDDFRLDDPNFGAEGDEDAEVTDSMGITCGRDVAANPENQNNGNGGGDAKPADDLRDLDCDELLVLFRSESSSGQQYGDASGFADSEVRAQVEVCLEREIVQGTAADEDLPDTGGLSLIGLAVLGVASAAAGLSVIRGGRR